MAITFIGAASAAADNVAVPTHQAGDLLVITAVGTASTLPTVPGGWTGSFVVFSGTLRLQVGYLVASASGTTSGSWTNASAIEVHVFRGASGIGRKANSGSNDATIVYAGMDGINGPDITVTDGTSWVAATAYHASASNLGTAPSGMTNRTTVGTGPMMVGHDTNGGVTTWPQASVSVNASGLWAAAVYELLASPPPTITAAVGSFTFTGQAATLTPVFSSFYSASATASTTSVTLPAHQAGDYIIIGAYRSASATAPTLAAGYTSVQSAGGNTNSLTVGYKLAASSAETSGTWANADRIIAYVARGPTGIGASTQNGNTGTAVNYPALTLTQGNGRSWVVGFGGHRSATNMETAPTGMTNRASVGAGPEFAVHDTNAGVASWSSTNVTANASSGWRTVVVELKGVNNSASLVSSVGTFSASGQAAALTRTQAAEPGAFTLAGQAANLAYSRMFAADLASYSLSGQAATFSITLPPAAEMGSFALSGQAVTLAAGLALSSASGSFAVSGQDAILRMARVATSAVGSFAFAGQDSILAVGRTNTAAAGSFTVTGQAAGLLYSRTMTASAASYAMSGQSVALWATRTLTIGVGSFAVTGQPATLSVGRAGLSAAGTYALNGQSASLTFNRIMAADAASLSFSGGAVSLKTVRGLAAACGVYDLHGEDAAFRLARALQAAPGSYGLSGQQAALVADFIDHYVMPADAGFFALSGIDTLPEGTIPALFAPPKIIREVGAPEWWGRAVQAINNVLADLSWPRARMVHRRMDLPDATKNPGRFILIRNTNTVVISNGLVWNDMNGDPV